MKATVTQPQPVPPPPPATVTIEVTFEEARCLKDVCNLHSTVAAVVTRGQEPLQDYINKTLYDLYNTLHTVGVMTHVRGAL